MLLRRIIDHLRSQNWLAVALDLIVVVVGIFLGFQVDRWYESNQRKSEESRLLESLAQDFSVSRERLDFVIDRHRRAVQSAIFILEIDDDVDQISFEAFYKQLRYIQWTTTPNIARSTYDLLIASGDINNIQSELLKAEMAAFFSVFDGRGAYMAEELRAFSTHIWLPFVNEHLDHVALMKYVHSDDAGHLNPSRPVQHYLEVLETPEFEAVIATKWHLSRDYIFNLQLMIDSVERIQKQLSDELN